jgi:hypothetical protein
MMEYAACIANSIFVMFRSVLCSVFSSVHIVSAEEMASSYFDLAALRNGHPSDTIHELALASG